MKTIECKACSQDTPRRIVLKRNPAIEITSQLPLHLQKDHKAFSCQNIIKMKRKGNQELIETCDTNIIFTRRKKTGPVSNKLSQGGIAH